MITGSACPDRDDLIHHLDRSLTRALMALVERRDHVRVEALAGRLARRHGRGLALRSRQLEAQFGFSAPSARQLEAAFQLAHDLQRARAAPLRDQPLTDAAAVVAYISQRLGPRLVDEEPREAVWIVAIDTHGYPLETKCVALGTANAVHVVPRDVFQPLLAVGATAGFLVHTHPEGGAAASAADRAALRRLVAAGDLLGVAVADMIVVAPDGYHSVLEDTLAELEEATSP